MQNLLNKLLSVWRVGKPSTALTEVVTVDQQKDHLKIESADPQGPVVLINNDGTIDVLRGPVDAAGKLFWEAVKIWGRTYQEQVIELQQVIERQSQTIITLAHDPYRAAVHNGYEVFAELPKLEKKRILTHGDVSMVLAAIERIAMRSIQ